MAEREDVDETLIVEMLKLTPTERIRQNDRVQRMIEELRDAVARNADRPPRR
ncbi:MAG TPA: hypothetical protein VL463_15920 [Kofleriaceae bacterium]|nr:hypothetical protein [Kofleriaceae bacterium]